MTPEQRAAAERIYRAHRAEELPDIYKTNPKKAKEKYEIDLGMLADAFIAEHPADEDEPVTLDRLEEMFHDSRCNVVKRGQRFFVRFSGSIEVKSEGDARRLRKALEGK